MAGPLPISYSDIAAYCGLKGIYLSADKERLVRLIDVLDKEYMSSTYEAMKSAHPTPQLPKNQRHRTDVPRHKKRAPTKEMSFR